MKLSLLIIFYFLSNAIYCQNLIPNHSFEEIDPDHPLSNLYWQPGWSTNRSDILLHWFKAGGMNFIVTSGIKGMNSYSGYNSIQLFLFNKKKEFRNYIGVRLKEPLIEDALYIFELNVKVLESVSNYAVNNIGIALKNDSVSFSTNYQIPLEPYYELKDIAFSEEFNWIKITDTIKAKGGENFLYLGNFSSNKNIDHKRISRKKSNISVYIFDEISLSSINPNIHFKTHRIDTMMLSNILFDTDSFNIKPEAFPILDSITLLFKDDFIKNIKILGHTDQTGDYSYNKVLSALRANFIRSYLIENGINENKIIAEGKGAEIPIANNNSEEGNSLNRRVEFIITRDKK